MLENADVFSDSVSMFSFWPYGGCINSVEGFDRLFLWTAEPGHAVHLSTGSLGIKCTQSLPTLTSHSPLLSQEGKFPVQAHPK